MSKEERYKMALEAIIATSGSGSNATLIAEQALKEG